jgi:hypothetical protein
MTFEIPSFRYWVPATPAQEGFFITSDHRPFEFYRGTLKIQGVQEVLPNHLQRCTNQLDRQGTLLWEGDIIFFPYSEIYLGHIEWSAKKGRFDILTLGDDKPLPEMSRYLSHCELLGHIFQYPQLKTQP